MAKSFRFPRWVEKTRTYSIHPVAFIDQPVATPHQSFLPIGSEVPLVKKSSFPPGEAKGQLRGLIPFNVLLCSICKWAASPLGSPSWRPLQLAIQNRVPYHSAKNTPSASLRSAAPSEREPRRLRRSVIKNRPGLEKRPGRIYIFWNYFTSSVL